MPSWAGPQLSYRFFLQKNGGIGCHLEQVLVSIVDHFLQKNGGKGCRTGQDLVSLLFLNFLQRNGGKGCHPGQDLVK